MDELVSLRDVGIFGQFPYHRISKGSQAGFGTEHLKNDIRE
jgi:hypothetical protein